MRKIITLCLLGLLSVSTVDNAQAQTWFSRKQNTAGNWIIYAANTGILFNNDNQSGATWNRANPIPLAFGGGLWMGGVINKGTAPTKTTTVVYDPNNGAGHFFPGSAIYDGRQLNSSAAASAKYQTMLSSSNDSSLWSVRNENGTPVYVDDIALRSSSGPSYYIGNEDFFIIYKNTDSIKITDMKKGDPYPQFEVRTQIGLWSKGFGQDVVIVKNQLIYLSSDTLNNPVVALALDGDIGVGGASSSNDKMRGFIQDSVQGVFFSSGREGGKTAPMLGIYLLRGTSGTNRTDNGLTTVRRWTIANDPATASARYDFMTNGIKDTTDNGITGDMRSLLASVSSKPLLQGDTVYFDYALFGYQPSNANPVDTSAIINAGKKITDLYKNGKLSNLAVKIIHSDGSVNTIENFSVSPNPATSHCFIRSQEAIRSLVIYDPLGRAVFSSGALNENAHSIEIDLEGLSAGVYYVMINNYLSQKFIKQ